MTLYDGMYERNTAPTSRNLDDIRNADMDELGDMAVWKEMNDNE